MAVVLDGVEHRERSLHGVGPATVLEVHARREHLVLELGPVVEARPRPVVQRVRVVARSPARSAHRTVTAPSSGVRCSAAAVAAASRRRAEPDVAPGQQ